MTGNMRILLSVCVASLLVTACSVAGNRGNFSRHPPQWVLEMPRESGKLYAVGTCGRTRVQADAWKVAADAARSELAKNIQAHVRNAFLHVQSTDGTNWAEEAFVVEATSSATDAVMANSQVVALWYDERGVVPGSMPGATYALAVMYVSVAAEAVKTKIENKMTKEQYEKVMNAISGGSLPKEK
jgi:hypothetical protein